MLDTERQSDIDERHDTPSRLLIFFAVLAVFVGGAGIGWLAGSPSTPDATSTTVVETAVSTAPPSTLATVTTAGPSTDPLVGTASTEPVADVAEALLPSVVQIELLGGGLGSGVIYDVSGLILTAAHVVEGFDTVQVRLSNGDRVEGRVLGVDTANDVAVVQVDTPGLTPAPLAIDTEPRAGQLAIALGSPWGLDSTVTSGIISAVDQAIPGRDGIPRLMLQTDASINPGNSGGPLADRNGRIVGINVSIYSTSGASDGVGFAIPIERAYRVARGIVEGVAFEPGFLGVQIDATATGQAGSVITSITPDSAAEAAGLAVGDIVVSVNGRPIGDFTDLAAVIRNYAAGDVVEIETIRDGQSRMVSVELGTRPASGG